jgi:dTDP-4-dehydrorhamnose 3,5-epimerase
LHYQYRQPQGKLVSVMEGRIFDVAVDIRTGSLTFGQWAGVELSAKNHRQMYIPAGFAHGFLVQSSTALFHYHCTTEYAPEYDAAIAWNDPDIAVKWPCTPESISAKDQVAPLLRDVPEENLPGFMN